MMRRYTSFRFYKNPAIKALLIGDSLVLTSIAMLTPIYAVFVSEAGGDLLDVGITAAALAFGSALAALLAGRVADKTRNKRRFVIIGYVITGLGFLLFTTVHSIWYLAAIQVVVGLVQAFAQPAYDALYSMHLDKGQEAEGWGAWEAVAYFAAGVGALGGAAIVSATNFSTLFVMMAALCLVSAIYVSRIPQKTL